MPPKLADTLVRELESTREFFNRSTGVLDEQDSGFAPVEGMMTVAQQVAHTAQTLEWFIEGATRPEGFDLDFSAHAKAVEKVTSLTAARAWYERAHSHLVSTLAKMSDDDLRSPLPAGPVMGGAPKLAIVGAIVDHTAHHRGALTVYTRLIGKTAPMPYMDM